MQFDKDYKGFSFSKDGPLDMRMNPLDKLTAKEISLMHKGKDLNEDLKTLKDLPGVGPNDNQVIFVISKRN